MRLRLGDFFLVIVLVSMIANNIPTTKDQTGKEFPMHKI